MSELIKNREYRQKVMQDIIRELHQGKSVEEVKGRFDEIINDVDPAEISLMEQSLINEGMPIEEVQRLCDVHASLFKEPLTQKDIPEQTPGHPVYTFRAENRALEKLIDNEIRPALVELKGAEGQKEVQAVLDLTEKLNLLGDVEKHYSRKENILFPYLEKYGISGPPQVMWGVDDEVRGMLKEVKSLTGNYQAGRKDLIINKTEKAIQKITEMIFKEEKILFPMAIETLSEDEWFRIMEDSDEIGYCLIEPKDEWHPVREKVGQNAREIADEATKGNIKFGTGVLTPEQISLIFNHLPVDITFVDKNGLVKYFSAGTERIFPRTRTIIGRKVENCHPPASVHVVEKLVEDFKSGQKDHEDFWLHLGDKYVYIRYFAVRNDSGQFAGVLEVSQDIKPVQAISGEKRLMS